MIRPQKRGRISFEGIYSYYKGLFFSLNGKFEILQPYISLLGCPCPRFWNPSGVLKQFFQP
jgi:hypothetical protein